MIRDSRFEIRDLRVQSRISNLESRIYWLVQDLADVPESDEWLSDSERSFLAGLRFPKRRRDWRLGRWTIKQAICKYLPNGNPSLSSLEIRAASDGAPEAFQNGAAANISISISHSNGRSLCAAGLHGFSIGCDLELLEERAESLVRDYFAPEEIFFCNQTIKREKAIAINLIWSAKESALKVLREGLRRDTRSVQIKPDFPGRENAWNSWTGQCAETSRIFHGWWRTSDGFVLTLASDHPTPIPASARLD